MTDRFRPDAALLPLLPLREREAYAPEIRQAWQRAKSSRSPEDFADYLTKAGLMP